MPQSAITKKQKRERDEIFRKIDEYAQQKTKDPSENPCNIPSTKKYFATAQRCKQLEKSLASNVDIESKKAQAESDKQISELTKSATADSSATAPAGAAAQAGASTAAPAGTSQATDDMTKYLAIGGVGLLLLGGVAYFLLRTPSPSATAPAK